MLNTSPANAQRRCAIKDLAWVVLFLFVAVSTAASAAQPAPAVDPPSPSDYAKALAAIRQLAAEVTILRGQVQALQATAKAAAPSSPSANPPPPPPLAGAVAATAPSAPFWTYGGLTLTPSGFIEAANVYRSKALGSDLFSPFGSIPFGNVRTGQVSEDRFSARQSRAGLLIEGGPGAAVRFSTYGEIDFLGAAQTANYAESNSFQPRLRHLYGVLDLPDAGWHFLFGQTWTLATLNDKGISPRNEVIPAMVDPQFVPGFVWARQPQVRIVKDFDRRVWLAVSLENAQTTFAGATPPGVISQIADSTGLFAGTVAGTAPPAAGGGAATVPTLATSSLNEYPDVVAKAATKLTLAGRPFHLEVFGLGRGFTDRVGGRDDTVYGGGVGVGFVGALVPGRLSVQLSALSGRGVGRYGTSGLPDVTFNPSGRIEPISETSWLVGATGHVTSTLDAYFYAGEEIEQRRAYGATYGLGIPSLDLAGCNTEGGACSATTHFVMQETIGFWRKVYAGPFGRLQAGMQYAYTERHAFSGADGLAPKTADNILFTSIRYYPF